MTRQPSRGGRIGAAVAVVAALSYGTGSAMSYVTRAVEGQPSPWLELAAKQVLDNEHVTAWDVTWRGRASRPTSVDQVAVTIEEGALKVSAPSQAPVIEWSRLGSVRVQPKGFAGTLEGVGGKARREIVVELKDTPPLRGKATAGIPGQFPRPGATRMFETDRLIVWDNAWDKASAYRHAHYSQVVAVFVEAGTIRSFADGDAEKREISRVLGEVIFSRPRPAPHAEQAGERAPRAIFLEFK